MGYEAKKSFIINSVCVILFVGIIWLSSNFLLKYLLPFVIASALAFAVQKPARFLASRLRIKSGFCAALLVVLVYIVGVGTVAMLCWQLCIQAVGFTSALPSQLQIIAKRIGGVVDNITRNIEKMPDGLSETVQSALNNALQGLIANATAFFSQAAANIASQIPYFLFSGIVTVVASCYIAKDFERLVRFVKGLIKPQTQKNLAIIRDILVGSILKFVLGYGILSLITFGELWLALVILRIKYAPVIAAVIAVVDLLPVLGSGTVLLPWAAVCFLVGNFGRGTGLIVVYLAVMAIRFLLEPRVIGASVGINPLLTLLALFLGLRIGGVGGMLLFPIVCIVVIDYYRRQLENERTAVTHN